MEESGRPPLADIDNITDIADLADLADLAEGTVYALLIRSEQRGPVDVVKIASEKGPPRKVRSINTKGRQHLGEFWKSWDFLAQRLMQHRPCDRWTREMTIAAT